LDVYPNLSGQAFLEYIAAIKRVKHGRAGVQESIARVGLANFASQKMGSYSNELRRRVGLAQALLNDPQFLFVDEPGVALPPQERIRFCQLLAQILGKTSSSEAARSSPRRLAVIATDDIADVAPVATSLVLLKEGALLSTAAPAEFVRPINGRVWSVIVEQTQLVEMRRQHLISRIERQDDKVRLAIVSTSQPHPDAVNSEPTLSDAYAYHIQGGESAISP
jgi:ABC-type multidrug transport system ATPase subunit